MSAAKLVFVLALCGLAWWRFGLAVAAFAFLTMVIAIGVGSLFSQDDMDDEA